MASPRVVFDGSYYVIVCASSQTIAKSQCTARNGVGWEPVPNASRLGDPIKPSTHACTCRDRAERSPCMHYQFQSPRQAPKQA